MYPLDFDSGLSDSPVIILSPHQHQFDPITRAAHSICRPTSKPVMDRRPYDMPLGKNDTRKRGQAELEASEPSLNATGPLPTPNPATSPEIGYTPPKDDSQIPLDCPDNPFGMGLRSLTEGKKRSSNPVMDPEDDDSDPPSPRALDNGHRRKASRHNSSMNVGDTLKNLSPIIPEESQKVNNESGGNTNGSSDIDPYKIAVGVSWAGIPDTPESDAAMRGNAAVIQRYHHLAHPQIHAESRERELLLVQADDGWYLFSEDLREGRMLSRVKTQALVNLACQPPVYEGKETLRADTSEIPAPSSQANGDPRAIEAARFPPLEESMFFGPIDPNDNDVEMGG